MDQTNKETVRQIDFHRNSDRQITALLRSAASHGSAGISGRRLSSVNSTRRFHMMLHRLLLTGTLVGILGIAAQSPASTMTYTATLSGANEVPPNGSTASGFA